MIKSPEKILWILLSNRLCIFMITLLVQGIYNSDLFYNLIIRKEIMEVVFHKIQHYNQSLLYIQK